VFRTSSFAALSLLPGLVACSGSHSFSHEELQTKFRASISLASETETFLSHLDGHIYSPHFIQGHLSYLQKQGSEIEKDLRSVSVETRDVTSFVALRNATGELTQTLNDLHSQTPNASAQASSINHLQSIRERLEANTPR
jgi:hypothetical protein